MAVGLLSSALVGDSYAWATPLFLESGSPALLVTTEGRRIFCNDVVLTDTGICTAATAEILNSQCHRIIEIN